MKVVILWVYFYLVENLVNTGCLVSMISLNDDKPHVGLDHLVILHFQLMLNVAFDLLFG